MILIRSQSIPCTSYEHTNYRREAAYRAENSRDHAMLQNANADAILKRYVSRGLHVWNDIETVHGTVGKESKTDFDDYWLHPASVEGSV